VSTCRNWASCARGWIDGHYEGAAEIERAWREGLTPDPLLTVSEWSDRHRMLSSKASAEPGRWRTSRTPYLKAIMDCLSPTSPVERVVFMKAAQLGATEMGIELDRLRDPPRARPDDGGVADGGDGQAQLQAADRSADRGVAGAGRTDRAGAQPRFGQHHPGQGVPGRRAGDDRRQQRGGPALDAGALSVPRRGRRLSAGRRGRRRCDLAGRGAHPHLRAAQDLHRLDADDLGASSIEREYEASDQRRYFVPCPHCSHRQWLRFEQLRWDKGQPETAAYICESCDTAIAEHHKTWMLEHGEWRAMAPMAAGKTAGFHLSSLYSPVGWRSGARSPPRGRAAVSKESGSAAAIKTFKNTELGETWVEEGEAPDWQRLVERREDYRIGSVPQGGLLLVGGADVQKDRIEASVWAFGRGKESWLVEHRVLMGDTARDAVWKRLG
jgi:hypothetical protein